jgi:hypothetical protein
MQFFGGCCEKNLALVEKAFRMKLIQTIVILTLLQKQETFGFRDSFRHAIAFLTSNLPSASQFEFLFIGDQNQCK